MKTASRMNHQQGSVLIATLGLVIVISIIAGSVLELVTQQYTLSKQTVAWNQSIYTAEAGIDLGWNELNKLTGINTNGGFMSGWTQSGTTFTKTGTLTPLAGTDGTSSYTVSVQTNVTVNSVAGGAVITSTGNKYGSYNVTNISRSIEVKVTPVNAGVALSYAMLAKGLIDFNGNAAVMDSFNSSTAAGGVWSTTARRAHGSAGTNGQLIDAAGLDIYGSLATGPGGTVTTDSGFRMYQPGSGDSGTNTVSSSLKVSIPDAGLPSGFAATSNLGTINAATTITANGAGTTKQVQASAISLNGNGKVLTISGSGKVQLYVTGNIDLGGQSSITVSPTSAGSLQVEIYVGGTTINLDGNGVINSTSKAADMLIFGLPTVTSVSINGTADFKGVIYAPSAALSLAGNARVDGAVVANTITAVGTVDFHYDEALNSITVGSTVLSYQLSSWREY